MVAAQGADHYPVALIVLLFKSRLEIYLPNPSYTYMLNIYIYIFSKLLRAGYIELWGVISEDIKDQFKCILMPKLSEESKRTALRCWARLP